MNALFRTLSPFVLTVAVLAPPAAHAQAAKPAPAATPAAPAAPIDAEKQKLIDRILVVFHPENAVLQAVQQQGMKVMQQSSMALQASQLPQDRKDKTMNDVQVDVKQYMDTTMPVAVASAKKFTAPLSAPLLAQNFTTEELRQLATMLESPLKQKFEQVAAQMQDAVGQKVSSDIGPQVNKNVQAMNEAAGGKLRAALAPK